MPHPMPFTRTRGLLAAASLLLAACSPTFNWRSVAVDGTTLQALMPCKPDAAEREVPLGGQPTRLQMRSCETGGLTFALAWADVGDTARVPDALAGWRRASLVSLRADQALADDPAARWAVSVPGADQALGLRASGRDAQGQPIEMRALHFSRGPWLFQAAVYGRRIDEAALAAFTDGLRLP